jgi:hypothetical protein
MFTCERFDKALLGDGSGSKLDLGISSVSVCSGVGLPVWGSTVSGEGDGVSNRVAPTSVLCIGHGGEG